MSLELPTAEDSKNPIDGIELLLTLAKTGKIDPWDLDIGQVTDQYLALLAELKAQDLQLTAKTLLYAAILLRMKSDSLSGVDFILQEEGEGEWGEDFLDETEEALPAKISFIPTSLDQVIQRRTSTKQPRSRRVTLTDLIRELKRYEELDKKRRLRDSLEKLDRRRVRSYTNLSSEEIVELAHDEFIEDTVLTLQTLLTGFFERDEAISLFQLEKEAGLDRISAYIALLFLTARGEADLHQETFYGDIAVSAPPPVVTPLYGTDADEAPLEQVG